MKSLYLLLLGLCLVPFVNAALIDFSDFENSEENQDFMVMDSLLGAESFGQSDMSDDKKYAVMLSALQTGEIHGAIVFANELKDIRATDIHVISTLAIAHVLQGEYKKAESLISQLAAKDKFEKSSILLAGALSDLYQSRNTSSNKKLEQIVKLLPKHAYALALMGRNYDAMGDIHRSREFLNKALISYPNFKLALHNLASLELANGNYHVAIEQYSKLIAVSDSCHFREGMATAELKIGLNGKAIKTLASCASVSINSKSVLLTVEALVLQKKYTAAWNTLSMLHKPDMSENIKRFSARLAFTLGNIQELERYTSGKHNESLFYRSLMHTVKGQVKEAKLNLSAIKKNRELLPRENILLALLSRYENGADSSLLNDEINFGSFDHFKYFSQLLSSKASSRELAGNAAGVIQGVEFDRVADAELQSLVASEYSQEILFGTLYYLLGSERFAKAFFDRIPESKRDFYSSYMIGQIFLNSREYSQAHPHLKKSIELAPNFYAARYGLADVFVAQKKYEKAINSYDILNQLRPEPLVYLKAGALSEKISDIHRAEENYKAVVRLAPKNSIGYNQLAWFYGSTNQQLAKAIELSEYSLTLSPGSTNYLDTLGWLHFQSGDLKRAKKILKQAVGVEGLGASSAIFHLAKVEIGSGNRQEAKRLLNSIKDRGDKYTARTLTLINEL